jgi:hypothetical protein
VARGGRVGHSAGKASAAESWFGWRRYWPGGVRCRTGCGCGLLRGRWMPRRVRTSGKARENAVVAAQVVAHEEAAVAEEVRCGARWRSAPSVEEHVENGVPEGAVAAAVGFPWFQGWRVHVSDGASHNGVGGGSYVEHEGKGRGGSIGRGGWWGFVVRCGAV